MNIKKSCFLGGILSLWAQMISKRARRIAIEEEHYQERSHRVWIFLGERFRWLSGVLIAALIVFIPCGYGGNPEWARDIINMAGGAAFLCWIPSQFVRLQMPRFPFLSLCSAGLLLALGWLMALNAKSMHDFDFWTFVPVVQPFDWLPGSVDARSSYDLMIRVSVLMGVFLICCDLCNQRRWLRRLVITMALVGTATAAFGIFQKISPTPWQIWPMARPPENAFATFWYHGNAATFLNIIWPLLVGLTLRSFQRGHSQILRALWLAALSIVLVGLLINVSKAGHVMAVLIAGAFLLVLAPRLSEITDRYGWREPLMLAVLAVAGLGMALHTIDWNQAWVRWNQYLSSGPRDSRLEVATICLSLAGEAGFFGYGPGTFDAVFQHYVEVHQLAGRGPGVGVRWMNAHNDYLQTLLDWGFVGTVLWGCFWFAPLSAATQYLFHSKYSHLKHHISGQKREVSVHRLKRQATDPLKVGASLSLMGIFIHSLYDFPLQIPGIELCAIVLYSINISKNDLAKT